jgi:predicted Zn-ribbon and HTH transcriptional regulator
MTKLKGEYRLNLNKVAKTEHHEYMFKLAIALNDFLSVQTLNKSLTISKSRILRKIRISVENYLLRLAQAHIYSAYEAFVMRIQPTRKFPKGQEPVYAYICKNHKSKQFFEQMQTIMKDPFFNTVRTLRNTFVFHYNSEKLSKATASVVKRLIEEIKQGYDSKDVNLILRTSNSDNCRFVFADEIMNIANQMYLPKSKPNNPEAQIVDYRIFLMTAATVFRNFAEETLLFWVVENKLQDFHK